MEQYTNEQLLAKYKALPKELQKIITDTNTSDIIQAIGKKYNLNIDQAGQLESEASRLILGFTHPKDFSGNLSERLGIDTETTRQIVQELNAQIFSQVKESLKRLHGLDQEESEPAAQEPPPKPASPFEQKLEEKVFPPKETPLKQEVEEAKKENRYPQDADPYKEPTN